MVGLREGRIASADNSTFAEVFEEWQLGRTIAERTASHERYLLDRHLATLKGQRLQKITASEVARVLRSMRDDGLSELTCSAVYRVAKGVFSLAVRRGILMRNPVDGLTPASGRSSGTRSDRAPGQRDTPEADRRRVHGAVEGRVRARGPRRATAGRGQRTPLGRHRPPGQTITVSRSVLPDGTPKPPKTDAGVRVVPLFPELRQSASYVEAPKPVHRSRRLRPRDRRT